jgi:hypothetical protein
MTKLDPRVIIAFADQPPAKTVWLEIEAPVDNEPTELFAALAAAGWQNQAITDLPPATKYDFETKKSLDYQYQSYQFVKYGTATFRSWTAGEAKANMKEAEAILRQFGRPSVPVWHKTWQDML